jgi:hypothetical protein
MSSNINTIEQEKYLNNLKLCIEENNKLKNQLSTSQEQLVKIRNELTEYKKICHDIIMKR